MKHLLTPVLMMTVLTIAYGQQSEIFATDGKAINGFDAVAFFKESRPVKGLDTLSYVYKNVTWLFSSRENLNAFAASPQQYTPEYGGYCAYGAAEGHKAPTETGTWTMHNGKLYFNYNQKVKSLWEKDRSALINKADQNWPLIKDKE